MNADTRRVLAWYVTDDPRLFHATDVVAHTMVLASWGFVTVRERDRVATIEVTDAGRAAYAPHPFDPVVDVGVLLEFSPCRVCHDGRAEHRNEAS